MSTIQLDDHLFREVEKWAAQSNRSLQAVVEDMIRAALPPAAGPKPTGRLDLPTYGGSGLQPGVDLDNSAGLLDITESRE